MRKTWAIVIFLTYCSLMSFSLASALDDESKLKVAAAQHEVISILLQGEQYHNVLGQFRKILDLGFEGEYERLVVEEAWLIVEQLLEVGQYSIAERDCRGNPGPDGGS